MTEQAISGAVPDQLVDAPYRSPLIDAGPDRALLRMPGIGRFLVGPDGAVVVDRDPGSVEADVASMLRGPVAALAELVAGRFCLRGAAVGVGAEALLLCGPSGSGTSAAAAALALRGYPTLAGPVVPVLAGRPPRLTPTGAAVELWPDVIGALGLDPGAGEPVRPALTKRSFVLCAAEGPEGPVPVRTLVLLCEDGRIGGGHPAAELVRLPPAASLAQIVEAQWLASSVGPLGLAAAHFGWLSDLAALEPRAVRWGGGDLATSIGLVADLALADR